MAGYDFTAIEKKWQEYWDSHGTFRQPNPGQEGFQDRPKRYILDMFPYPSGAGLHVGHPEGYTATDIIARYSRMKGLNVLHPMGYDAFGLPAQQYAVEHGIHPRVTTERNIANIERQIKMMGFSYDWSRRLATTDPDYYRWTQWILLRMFNSWYDPEADAARPIRELVNRLESGQLVPDFAGNIRPAEFFNQIPELSLTYAGVGQVKFYELDPDQQRRLIDEYRLAYMAEVPVNWCPMLGTVLANEEVTNEGRSDRGDHPVYRRNLRQWMLRITAYAERLLEDLDLVDWPESIKTMQRNWVGKSEGADVDFPVVGTTGVSPVGEGVPPFLRSSRKAERFLLTGRSFTPRNPYPPGEPSPDDLLGHIRNLPHLELPGATYFVTFHAAEGENFTPEDKDIILRGCLHWHEVRSRVSAAVVLGNHLHMLFRPFEGHGLDRLLHSIKSFTSHEIGKGRGRGGSIWVGESFDHVVRDSQWLTSFIYYICENPVKYGLTEEFDRYPWLWVNSDEILTQETGRPFGNSRPDEAEQWFGERATSGFPNIPEQGEDEGQGAHPTTSDRRDACRTRGVIRVYTTRPDTLFGATYMVLAPEHPLVQEITADAQKAEVRAYVEQAARKSELERAADTKEKTGVFTGAYAVNPVNKERIPIWVADYVMMGYGTGAIMAVPAHDTRDYEFARKFELPIVQVVQPPEGTDWRGYVDDGIAVNSGKYDGLPTAEFKKKITGDLHEAGLAKAATNYKLRDWIFSRQWYWGEPFPIVHCDNCGAVGLPEDQLPLLLPEMDDFSPPAASNDPDAPPEPPLSRAAEWVKTTCPSCGGPATRETNAMPQWAGSCWYYLRFLDPRNDKAFCDPKVERYWMGRPAHDAGNPKSETQDPKSKMGGVDLYVGGAEHAVLHLLYARFWHKVLYDLGHVSTPEPFHKLFNQGMIRSFAYRDKRGVYVGYDKVDLSGDKPRHKDTGEELTETVEKMSKSLKNVVNPDDVVAEYGADTFRLYEMFMGPLESSKPWNTRDVPGVHRFLNRVWRMIVGSEDQPSLLASAGANEVERALHRTIRKVGEDIEAMKFNTAIAAMMEFVNQAYKVARVSQDQAERFILVLAPFAPHLCEELWQRLGHGESLAYEPWPPHDEALTREEMIEVPVQVNGKVRARIQVAADASEADVLAAALAEPKIAAAVEGKTVVRKIVVPGRLVNVVVK